MNNKQATDNNSQNSKEELLQEGRVEKQSPFENVQQNNPNGRSLEEETEAEQQYKEALTERD